MLCPLGEDGIFFYTDNNGFDINNRHRDNRIFLNRNVINDPRLAQNNKFLNYTILKKEFYE